MSERSARSLLALQNSASTARVLNLHKVWRMAVYDDAYAKLTQDGRPTASREFLLDAPELFMSLGERLGAVSHVTSFWRCQFPAGMRTRVSFEELSDVLYDFEASLALADPAPAASKAA